MISVYIRIIRVVPSITDGWYPIKKQNCEKYTKNVILGIGGLYFDGRRKCTILLWVMSYKRFCYYSDISTHDEVSRLGCSWAKKTIFSWVQLVQRQDEWTDARISQLFSAYTYYDKNSDRTTLGTKIEKATCF